MKNYRLIYRKGIVAAVLAASATLSPVTASAIGENDPASVVEQWSDASTFPKVIDINFSDTSWPDTWGMSGNAKQCPELSSGVYVNAILTTPVLTSDGVTYPVNFHNCTFATTASNNGFAATTAAFARQYYDGDKATNYNDWKQPGHTHYLEENIKYENGKPVYGEAGFVQMCRNAAQGGVSQHGWMQIDHVPYIERIQWSWSSTSWGRGIKCDIKIGDGEWKPLVWMGSEKQKQGWTVFADQGYFMENVIDASDVSLRWRVWDGEDQNNFVQNEVFNQAIDPMAQRQAPRVHKIQIFGNAITAEQAEYAKAHPVSDVGELTDLSKFGYTGSDTKPSPDENARIVLLYVNPDGSGDYTAIQPAIDAVPSGHRGIIYIAPGIYDENIYAGRKGDSDRFISLIGADPATTILTSSVSRGSGSATYNDCAALNVYTPCFYAEGLTIRNTSGNNGQAEALYTAGDAHVFKNCILSGFQDTYKANVGARGYFKDCIIEGGTDFIYDGGLEWFEDCEIRSLKGGQYITAPGSASVSMTKVMYPELVNTNFYAGLFFNNCRLTAGEGVADNSYYLGRPWDDRSGTMFLNCTIGSHIRPEGWYIWNADAATVSLYEYRSVTPSGTLADISSRASFSRQAADNEVEAYFNPDFLFAKLSKTTFDYASVLRGAAAPCNFTVTSSAITWEGDDVTAGYIIYKNGEFMTITDRAVISAPEAGADYSVSSISRHGAVSPAVKAADATQVLAFPTAEGFGKYASGGRGGKVVTVTSLADDGSEGTLRWAFNQHKDSPVTIVFAVNGEIALTSELRVNRADWTLAGQTAPGEGITITRNKVNLGGSRNFIVRNVRFRIGQRDMAGNIIADNACGAENCANFIFDHCSFGWSVEENMNTADSHFLTVQYSIVHEGLYNAGHSKGARGYGCQWGGSPATYHHNLLAHNNSRSARLNGARGEDYVVFMEYANNVNYNYGKRGGCYGGENSADITSYNGLNSAHECNFMGNYYKPGANSDKSTVEFVNASYARDGATSWAPAKWYVNGNKAEGISSATADNWTAMSAESYSLSQIKAPERIVTATPYYKYTAAGTIGNYQPQKYMLDNIESADAAYATVLDKAGTVNRDKVELRVINDTRTGKNANAGGTLRNGIIDTETQAEGFFTYTAATSKTDTDHDGMPDEWERANGLNPEVADNNLVNSEGYTALEAYINSLMGESYASDFRQSGIQVVSSDKAGIKYDGASATLSVSDVAVGSFLTVYTTDGKVCASSRIKSTSTSLSHLPSGIYLLHITSPLITPAVLKIVR